MLRSSATAMK